MDEIVSNNKNTIIENSIISTIAFISDLHFDFTDGKYCIEQSEKKTKDFIDFIKENYNHSLLCIAGDCFNNYQKTLAFIRELEQQQINGFYVLGNHDYWNDGTKSYDEIIQIFEETTKDYKFFRFLTNGLKYYINGICFIGDTGWTSFRRKNKRVNLNSFMELPDVGNVKGFCPKQIIAMHDSWINYANETLRMEDKTIILTHFPMMDFSRKAEECWWSSETNLNNNINCWKIFGHTHKEKQKKDNHISSQRGYDNIDNSVLEECSLLYDMKQYDISSFGILLKINNNLCSDLLDISPLRQFFSLTKVQDKGADIILVNKVEQRGFKRCSKNKEIFAQLASEPYKYLRTVKEIIKGYEINTYIGYKLLNELSGKTIHAVYTSIALLEKSIRENNFINIKAFVISALVTGYVYNDMTHLIDSMRPCDDYDILRFYLMFQTIKRYKLRIDNIPTIRKHSSRYISFANIDVYLPVINGQCLTIDEAYTYLRHIQLLGNHKI